MLILRNELSRICRLICLTTGLFLSGGGTGFATYGQDFAYPGPAPGPAKLVCLGQNIAADTAAISVTWTLTDQRLKPQAIRDERAGQSVTLHGEVFQIVLTDGPCYAASSLLPEGKPRVSELVPDPQAARWAARIPGRQIELPLRSADGRLAVVWRAVMHDGANYVRQEIDVTATREDCLIKDIVWLEETIPGARRAGRVDGSPVVAGAFFLGSEDPHSRNLIEAPRHEIGKWSPEDLELGRSRPKTWQLDASQVRAGTQEIVFQYERGPHRLDIAHVALLENGHEVSRDDHPGRTGTEHVDNVYSLVLPQVQPEARYELTARLGTDPGLKLPAGGHVDSQGKVFLQDSAGPVSCRLRREAPLRVGEKLTQSFVIGVAPPGQMRRAFLVYLERERAHPYRPFLHYNSWYDIAMGLPTMNEANCLEVIRAFGENLIRPHGVTLDATVFDDGWDDPQSLWQFHSRFPTGFAPHAELCRQYGTHVGVWLSPFGGYGTARDQRLKHGREQGYEINATGFSLAGPKYYAAFKDACLGMMRKYGVNYFKFDGIATGMYASGGGSYVLDTEAMRRLMLDLRQEDPNVYINLTTGSWPSPFWLRYADSVWRQGDDMGLAGRGTRQQQWLTYRDQETYRNIVRKGPLYPLNALMTQGVAYSRLGMAGDPTFNSAGFRDDVRAFFGAGTSLQELYIQPGRLTAEDWRTLAEAAKWSRARADVLVDTHWISGDPSQREVYGYASWTPRQGLVMLRNPDDQPHDFALDLAQAFELPPGAPTKYTLKSPWAADAQKPAVAAEAGQPLRLTLQPFEVLVLDATPQ